MKNASIGNKVRNKVGHSDIDIFFGASSIYFYVLLFRKMTTLD